MFWPNICRLKLLAEFCFADPNNRDKIGTAKVDKVWQKKQQFSLYEGVGFVQRENAEFSER